VQCATLIAPYAGCVSRRSVADEAKSADYNGKIVYLRRRKMFASRADLQDRNSLLDFNALIVTELFLEISDALTIVSAFDINVA
jgi:hypothetical protein